MHTLSFLALTGIMLPSQLLKLTAACHPWFKDRMKLLDYTHLACVGPYFLLLCANCSLEKVKGSERVEGDLVAGTAFCLRPTRHTEQTSCFLSLCAARLLLISQNSEAEAGIFEFEGYMVRKCIK